MSFEEETTTQFGKVVVIGSIVVTGICLLVCVYESSMQFTRTRGLFCLACATTAIFCILSLERVVIGEPSPRTFYTIAFTLMAVYVWAIALSFLDLGRRFYPPTRYRTFTWKLTIFLAMVCSAGMITQAVWLNIREIPMLTLTSTASTYVLSWMVGISGFAYAFMPLLLSFRRCPCNQQTERNLNPRNVSVGLWYIFTSNSIGAVYITWMIYMLITHGRIMHRPAAASANSAMRAMFVTTMCIPPPRWCLRLIQRYWFGKEYTSENLSSVLTEPSRDMSDLTNESREGIIMGQAM